MEYVSSLERVLDKRSEVAFDEWLNAPDNPVVSFGLGLIDGLFPGLLVDAGKEE